MSKVGELNAQQVAFIERKVQELGSVEKVRAFYRKKDRVSEFAHLYARWYYGASNGKAWPVGDSTPGMEV